MQPTILQVLLLLLLLLELHRTETCNDHLKAIKTALSLATAAVLTPCK
jgi:hypothetical protein